MKDEYEIQAEKFLAENGLGFTASYVTHEAPRLWGGNDYHAKYRVTIRRKAGNVWGVSKPMSMSFTFYQSLAHDGDKPTAYDALACLSAESYYYEEFSEFCGEFGYGEDSRKAYAVWKAVNKLSQRVLNFFTEEELTELRDIN